jgi:prepilin-type N-terminal cleavage/methylation domain-containing protein
MSDSGMTLIEVLVTVLILTMLTSIATLSVGYYINEGKTRIVNGDLATLKAAVRLYILDKNVIPSDFNLQSLVPDYLPELPKDPFAATSTDYCLDATTDLQNIYIYSIGPNGRNEAHGGDDIVVTVNQP